MSIDRITQIERIDAVFQTDDPVLRNLLITQSYHDLSLSFHPIFGENHVWTGFAVWASKQAGVYIRNEEVPEPLRKLLDLDPRGPRPFGFLTALFDRSKLLDYLRLSVEDVSGHIADGNRRVYHRLAPLFADFLRLARRVSEPDPDHLEAFLAELDRTDGAGPELRQAFKQYYEALFERNGKRRAERLLAANLLVGYHEQMRLQDAIEGSISAPVRRALADPERRLGPFPTPLFLRKIFAFFGKMLLGRAIAAFEKEWEHLATRYLMTLATPDGVLDLSEDLPPLPDGSLYPPALQELTLPVLEKTFARFDADPDGARDSGACDWTNLNDRMAFICELFRSRQQDEALLQKPFDAEQESAIRAGRVPDGPL